MNQKKERPKINLNPRALKAVEKFANHAVDEPVATAAEKVADKIYPWEDPMLRPDVTKLFNLRLSEQYIEKLKWLSERTGQSRHKIITGIVYAHIDQAITQLTRTQE